MKIEKDAEWNRLEGRVGQLQDKLKAAKYALEAHAKKSIAQQAGVVLGETMVELKGVRFLVSDVETTAYCPWFFGRKIRKDGNPADLTQRLGTPDRWTIVQP